MNKELALIKTTKAIQDAIKRVEDMDIGVTEFCRQAGISRHAYYRAKNGERNLLFVTWIQISSTIEKLEKELK